MKLCSRKFAVIPKGLSLAIGFLSFFAIVPARAQWQQANPPSEHFVTCFAESGTNLFAGTGGGVFLSTNSGTSWTSVSTGLTNDTIRTLAVDGTDIFAGTLGGLFRSTNNGASWTASGFADTGVGVLGVSGSDLFTDAHLNDTGGVSRSTDYGASWTVFTTGIPNHAPTDVNCFAVSGANLFFGANGDGIFRSIDNGSSWTAVDIGLTDSFVTTLAVIGANLFAGTMRFQDHSGNGVYRSTDNGTSWSTVNTGLTNLAIISLAVNGTNLFAGTIGGGVFLSTNNGSSWTAVNSGLSNDSIQTLTVSGEYLFAGTYYGGGGVWRRPLSDMIPQPSSGQWVNTNGPFGGSEMRSSAVIGTNLFMGQISMVDTTKGVYHTTDGGANWTTSLTQTGVGAMAVSGTNLFAGGGYNAPGIFRSNDNAASWTSLNTPVGDSDIVGAILVSGTNIFAGIIDLGLKNGSNIYLSTNNGTSWISADAGLTGAVLSLAENGTNIFAGTFGDGVFLSTNNGTSWTAVNSGLTNETPFALLVSGSDLFAGTYGGGVFLSTNNGTSWSTANVGMTTDSVDAFAMSGTNLFAGTTGGVFLSTNNGTSWTPVNSGLTSSNVTTLAVSGTNLFAGTYNGQVWYRPLSEIVTLPARDTQATPLRTTGTDSVALSGDSATYRAHRIDFVNTSGGTLTVLSAALTTSGNRFSISQFLHSIPDTVLPNDTFSMIVNFFGNDSGTVFLDTLVLTIDPNLEITSYYVYLKGNSFSTAPSGVAQNSRAASADLQSYPNPTSASETLLYSLPSESSVSITIYDALGRVVSTPLAGEMESAGQHATTFDTQGLPPGLYSCRLTGDGINQSAKLVIAR